MARHRVYLVIFAGLYVLGFAIAFPSYIDEAYTYHLVTDPSLIHMLSALRHGADGTFPIFGIFAFVWARIFGSSELSLRITGGLFVVLWVWQMGERLRRYFAPWPVTIALLLVMTNFLFVHGMVQARGYGLLIFAFSLLFWSTWDLIADPLASRRQWLLHAFYCGVLWLSHPLGMIYASILAFLYVCFSAYRRKFSWTRLAAFSGGPLLFLVWLPSFLIQRMINVNYPPGLSLPGWKKYWDYAFLASPGFFVALLLGVILLVIRKQRIGDTNSATCSPLQPDHPPRTGLLIYAASFIVLLNVVIALLNATGIIPIYLMLAVRYALVAVAAFAVLFSAIGEQALRWISQIQPSSRGARAVLTTQLLIILVLLWQMQRTWSEWWTVKNSREPYLRGMVDLARQNHLDILCVNHVEAFFLQTRFNASSVKYLLEDDNPFRTLLLQHHAFYPSPVPLSSTEFRRYRPASIIVPLNGPPFIKTESGEAH